MKSVKKKVCFFEKKRTLNCITESFKLEDLPAVHTVLQMWYYQPPAAVFQGTSARSSLQWPTFAGWLVIFEKKSSSNLVFHLSLIDVISREAGTVHKYIWAVGPDDLTPSGLAVTHPSLVTFQKKKKWQNLRRLTLTISAAKLKLKNGKWMKGFIHPR